MNADAGAWIDGKRAEFEGLQLSVQVGALTVRRLLLTFSVTFLLASLPLFGSIYLNNLLYLLISSYILCATAGNDPGARD